MIVRLGRQDDLAAILDIYNWYVLHSNATFDVEPISTDRAQIWFDQFAATGPHRLVAVVDDDDHACGYAASVRYREHPAFRETVELTTYIDADRTGRGLGTLMYDLLLSELADEPVHTMLAGIALPNDGSIALHRHFGFEPVGVFDEYAEKHGRRLSSLWMQRGRSSEPRRAHAV